MNRFLKILWIAISFQISYAQNNLIPKPVNFNATKGYFETNKGVAFDIRTKNREVINYAKHFERSVFGEDYFQWERNMEMRRAMSADDKNDLPIAHSESGSSRHYPKGSFVIDMLREAAGGDEAYKKVINEYTPFRYI